MAYTTSAKVKEWLNIPSSNTQNDAEISSIITSVEHDIDLILKGYTTLPIQPEFSGELSDISAEWCAGVFCKRRAPRGEASEQLFICEAKERLQRLIESHFISSFEKTEAK